MNLADLRRTLGVDGDGVGVCGMGNSTMGHASEADDDGLYGADSKARQRRLSMERMDLLKVCFAYASPQLYVIFLFAFLHDFIPAHINFFHWLNCILQTSLVSSRFIFIPFFFALL